MNRKRNTAIIVTIIFVLALAIIAVWQSNTQNKEEKNYQNLEEIREQEKTPEDNVKFLNFGALIDKGATSSQIANLKKAILAYSPNVKEAIIFSTSLTTESYPEDPNLNPTANFIISIDNISYNANIEYVNNLSITAIHFYLSDLDNNQVFDSGIVKN